MQWSGEGIVLGARRHGESNAILEVMTRERGRHLGLVRGGAGPRLRPTLQPGNTVAVTWRARLDEHLGNWTVETLASRAARLIASPLALHGVALLAAHLRLLPERDPHPALYDALTVILDRLDDAEVAGPLLVRFEVALLDELGFGLDLAECAATGARADLTHVSPKSGRAVSRTAAEPYRDRLFALPAFLAPDGAMPGADDVADGFRLTGFFLERHVWGPRAVPEPECRAAFLMQLVRAHARVA
jgi:DNA repair protein RecO (recombination protein O)